VLELHGWGLVGEQLSALAARGKWSDMPALITDEMLDAVAVLATWDDVADRIRARYAGLFDRVGFYRPFVPGVDESRWRNLIHWMRDEA